LGDLDIDRKVMLKCRNNAYRVLVVKPDGKRLVGRPTCRLENNIIRISGKN
jgi:hypothetical protein